MSLDYPEVRAAADDDSTAELVEDYDMSDPDRTKIKPLKSYLLTSAKERYILFERIR